MWWFPALASLLIGRVESENTNIPAVWKEVASRAGLAALQFGHHFTTVGCLAWYAWVNPPSGKVSGLLLLWQTLIFSKAALTGRTQAVWPSRPCRLPWKGPPNGATAWVTQTGGKAPSCQNVSSALTAFEVGKFMLQP